MNDSDLVLIRTSIFLGIGSLRKKLQPFKDHRKNEKFGDQRRCNQNINENLPKNVHAQINYCFCAIFSSKMNDTLLKSLKTIVFHIISDAGKIFDFDENKYQQTYKHIKILELSPKTTTA